MRDNKHIRNFRETWRNYTWRENLDYISQWLMPAFIVGLVMWILGAFLALLFTKFAFLHGLFSLLSKIGPWIAGISGILMVIVWFVGVFAPYDTIRHENTREYKWRERNGLIATDSEITKYTTENQEYIRKNGGTPLDRTRH